MVLVVYLAGSRAALGDGGEHHARLPPQHGHQSRAHVGLGCLLQHLLVRGRPLICLHANHNIVKPDLFCTSCLQAVSVSATRHHSTQLPKRHMKMPPPLQDAVFIRFVM